METKEEITGRVYLSGKMRGLTQRQYRAHFQKATNELIIKHHVHPSQIINPCYIARAVPCFEDDEYLELDFKILKRCHAIYMLNNWQDSEGAKAEKAKAEELGLKIYYEPEEELKLNGKRKNESKRISKTTRGKPI